jgi:hypothetical protein
MLPVPVERLGQMHHQPVHIIYKYQRHPHLTLMNRFRTRITTTAQQDGLRLGRKHRSPNGR